MSYRQTIYCSIAQSLPRRKNLRNRLCFIFIDTDGKVSDVKNFNSIDPELDETAKTIIRQSPRWEPAVQYNRNVKAYRKQPITFAKAE
ncbi:MAG: energy transducer TonB [Bacteroidota bacterium]